MHTVVLETVSVVRSYDEANATARDVQVNDWISFGRGWALVNAVDQTGVWVRDTLRAFGWPRPAGDGWERRLAVLVYLADVTVIFDADDRVTRMVGVVTSGLTDE